MFEVVELFVALIFLFTFSKSYNHHCVSPWQRLAGPTPLSSLCPHRGQWLLGMDGLSSPTFSMSLHHFLGDEALNNFLKINFLHTLREASFCSSLRVLAAGSAGGDGLGLGDGVSSCTPVRKLNHKCRWQGVCQKKTRKKTK